MSNATSNLIYKAIGREGRRFHLPVDGGSHIYEGTLVAQLTATGCVVPASTASSGPAIGVATPESNNTGADGATRLIVETDRVYAFVNGTSTDACSEATLIGSVVYALDDHTVADNSNGNTLQPAGLFMGMEADGKVRVLVSPAKGGMAEDVGALTYSAVAGTANTTLQAVPDPADAPGTADVLRDDIVANDLPAIRNNFADLASQLNAVRTALRSAGLMA